MVQSRTCEQPAGPRSHKTVGSICFGLHPYLIAEISRILRSGGVFVGTTFLRYTSSTPWIRTGSETGKTYSYPSESLAILFTHYEQMENCKHNRDRCLNEDQFFPTRILQNYSYLTEEEIEDVCTSCGLTNYSSKVQQSFIMFSAQKP
ncbi:hypothetical protein Patl1_14861 [Pistacia atlantica]|uniref:Uncharacterized protein n=1 Tax=Pistacia atlantica TaxID=434234 RepID=A0ACC1AX32_9ROSI|nr:hypothetical protein Patl1_14861 [Pistacia atlantica]